MMQPSGKKSHLCGTILCAPEIADCGCKGIEDKRCRELNSIGRIVFVEKGINQHCKAKHPFGEDVFCACPARKPSRHTD